MLRIFPYNKIVINLTMTINGACNRRAGPGGGTRRLHHEGAKQDRQALKSVTLRSVLYHRKGQNYKCKRQ